GPGSGKGTQCSKIAAHLGFCHLSAGELLDIEVESGSENGTMIKAFKMEGKLVPADMIIKLLQQAMEESITKKFLIDGFPRNNENRAAFENITKLEPEFVLFFECSNEVMRSRLLNRNQGRADDNSATITKRLQLYLESTLPVVNYYSSKGKVYKVGIITFNSAQRNAQPPSASAAPRQGTARTWSAVPSRHNPWTVKTTPTVADGLGHAHGDGGLASAGLALKKDGPARDLAVLDHLNDDTGGLAGQGMANHTHGDGAGHEGGVEVQARMWEWAPMRSI
ncbi:hypothetical protein RJ639_033802, partial [Escallonia herrerae]